MLIGVAVSGLFVGIVVGVGAGVAVGLVVARRAAVLVATTVTHAQTNVRSQLDAAARHDLAVRQESFERRTGELRAELARVSDLVVGLQRERAEQQGRVEERLAEVASVSGRLA